ncbi:MAG: 2-hydroxy-6-oxonona-2,4-dienedioate hydrolase [Acidimicrobiales bacterium]|jgi:2-hydroxy-6-oxonona-2,4-dienedioate hydrolase
MTLSLDSPHDDAAALAYVERFAASADRVETRSEVGAMVWHRWGDPGRPLVLLHGGSGSWTHWIHTIPWFMNERTVIAADLPGMGDSPDPPEPYTADSLAELVARALEQLVDAEVAVDLVGFSFGGIVAGHLAANFAERVRRLVVVGSPPFGMGSDGPANDVRAVDPLLDFDAAREQHRHNLQLLMMADPGSVDPLALRIHHDNLRRSRLGSRKVARAGTLEGALRRVACPLYGIWGEEDVMAYPDLASIRELFTSPGVAGREVQNFDVLPGVGHWAAYESPDEFNRLLERRLNEPLTS